MAHLFASLLPLDRSYLEGITDFETLVGHWHLFLKTQVSMSSHGIADEAIAEAVEQAKNRILELEPSAEGRLSFLELMLMLDVGHQSGETAESCLLCILEGAS